MFEDLNTAGGCQLRIMTDGVGIEKTAEWCFKAAKQFLSENYGDRCVVSKVEVWEHAENSATYQEETLTEVKLP
jgi:hypothetical protein